MAKKTYSVSEFKAKSLSLIEWVSSHRESIVVTKRGKPIAEVVPLAEPVRKLVPGKLSDALISEDDIVSPLGSKLWKAAD